MFKQKIKPKYNTKIFVHQFGNIGYKMSSLLNNFNIVYLNETFLISNPSSPAI